MSIIIERVEITSGEIMAIKTFTYVSYCTIIVEP